jgi:hypothetical protein
MGGSPRNYRYKTFAVIRTSAVYPRLTGFDGHPLLISMTVRDVVTSWI